MGKVCEVWLPIFGLSNCGYEVSNLGNVRSWRWCTHTKERPRALKPYPDRNGYQRVSLRLHEGKRRHYTVHRLVAKAFMCPYNGREEVNHKDGNPANNKLENLEWCTRLENQRHAIEEGLNDQRGNRTLSDSEVRRIRMMAANGMSYSQIRRRFPIPKSTLSNLINRRTYAHL